MDDTFFVNPAICLTQDDAMRTETRMNRRMRIVLAYQRSPGLG